MNIVENGDSIFNENNELTSVGYVEDIKNNLACIFNTRKGEFFLDIDMGLDYTSLELKGSSDEVIIADFMEAIAQEERVTEIISIDIVRDNKSRVAYIDIVLKADDVTIELQEVMLGVWDK